MRDLVWDYIINKPDLVTQEELDEVIAELSEDIDGGAPDTVYDTDDIIDGGGP